MNLAQAQPTNDRIVWLDVIRAFAILMVIGVGIFSKCPPKIRWHMKMVAHTPPYAIFIVVFRCFLP